MTEVVSWEFEGWVGKLKFAAGVDFVNGILFFVALNLKDYENDYYHYASCQGKHFNDTKNEFFVCFENLLDKASELIRNADEIEIRICRPKNNNLVFLDCVVIDRYIDRYTANR